MPIATVDYIIIKEHNRQELFLLAKRCNKPYKGQWYISGGRIIKGESITSALERKLEEELGLGLNQYRFLFPYSHVNSEDEFGIKYHSIQLIFKVYLEDTDIITHSPENSSTKFFSAISKSWPKAVREILELAGFSYNERR